jgi:hypothetical protein
MTTYDIMPFCFVIVFSNAHNHTQEKRLYEKMRTYFFQDRALGHMVAFKCLHKLKDYDHSPALVCTRGVFGYRVMTSGGHVYPNQFLCSLQAFVLFKHLRDRQPILLGSAFGQF